MGWCSEIEYDERCPARGAQFDEVVERFAGLEVSKVPRCGLERLRDRPVVQGQATLQVRAVRGLVRRNNRPVTSGADLEGSLVLHRVPRVTASIR